MKVTFVELSSGFGNVANVVILEANYSSDLMNRPGSAYDKYHTVEMPDGFVLDSNAWGEQIVVGKDGAVFRDFVIDDGFIVMMGKRFESNRMGKTTFEWIKI